MNWLESLLGISDEQAMWRVQTANDHEAFALLVERYEGKIRSLCHRMTGDGATAEDLAQETFKRLFERRKDYNPARKFGPYIWRIGVNVCYDELRRRQRRAETNFDGIGEVLVELHAPETGRLVEAGEESQLVRKALLQLPEIYRAVLILRHYEGLKLREIAETLEVPEGTVNSRMAEALTRMTDLLKKPLGIERKKREEMLTL